MDFALFVFAWMEAEVTLLIEISTRLICGVGEKGAEGDGIDGSIGEDLFDLQAANWSAEPPGAQIKRGSFPLKFLIEDSWKFENLDKSAGCNRMNPEVRAEDSELDEMDFLEFSMVLSTKNKTETL